MRKGIAIAGNLIVDHVKSIDVYPKLGMLSNITAIQRCVGGCVNNTIINIAKIDASVPLSAFGKVGNDENGRYIIDMLKKHQIETAGVIITDEAPTSFTDVMTEEDGGIRTFFHARGANAHFGVDDIDFDSINAEFFHIGYALLLDEFDAADEEYGTKMARALAYAKQRGLKTSIDVVSENSDRFRKIVTPSLKYCDYLIINEVEASMITELPVRESNALNPALLKRVCGELKGKGVNDTVVIHAPEGACAMERSGCFSYVPSLQLPEGFIKGSVGAGDAFCAGMLYSLYHQFDIKYALQISAGAAACSLTHVNSIDGMQDLKGIKGVVQKYA